jgi:hypothetical protein
MTLAVAPPMKNLLTQPSTYVHLYALSVLYCICEAESGLYCTVLHPTDLHKIGYRVYIKLRERVHWENVRIVQVSTHVLLSCTRHLLLPDELQWMQDTPTWQHNYHSSIILLLFV